MGSILSAIANDKEDYQFLCKKYGERMDETYSLHYHWLNDKNDGKTDLSYIDYKVIKDKESLLAQIKTKERELSDLKGRL